MSIVNFAGSTGKSNFAIPTNHLTRLDGDKRYLNIAGDGMSGKLNMNLNRIIKVSTPVFPTDAVNKFYIDQIIEGNNKQIQKRLQDLEILSKNFESNNKRIQENLKRLQDLEMLSKNFESNNKRIQEILKRLQDLEILSSALNLKIENTAKSLAKRERSSPTTRMVDYETKLSLKINHIQNLIPKIHCISILIKTPNILHLISKFQNKVILQCVSFKRDGNEYFFVRPEHFTTAILKVDEKGGLYF